MEYTHIRLFYHIGVGQVSDMLLARKYKFRMFNRFMCVFFEIC